MTSPGPVEHVPLKVVPIYVQPFEELEQPESPVEDAPPPAPDRPGLLHRWPLLGAGALVLLVAEIVVHIVAIVVATNGDFVGGTILSFVSVALSVLAVGVGVVAALLRSGRRWGIFAALVAVLANPLVLLYLLRFLGGAAIA